MEPVPLPLGSERLPWRLADTCGTQHLVITLTLCGAYSIVYMCVELCRAIHLRDVLESGT